MPNPEIMAFLKWGKTRNVGCMFARAMFSLPEKYGIQNEHIAIDNQELLSSTVGNLIEARIDDPNAQGLIITFAKTLPLESFAAMLRGLSKREGWVLRTDETTWSNDEYTSVGLDVDVGEDADTKVLSEIVAFGPYSYLPITRRSPVPALTLRTKPEFSDTPLPGREERRANLASIPIDIPSKSFDKLAKESRELRAKLNGKINPLVRARVTFPFLTSVWKA